MSMTAESAEYFDRVAGEWDHLRTGFFSEAVRAAALAKAYLRPEMIVADVGAGTGFMSAGLAPVVSRVYALDGSPAMLEVAHRNLAGFANVTFQLAEGDHIPLDVGSVDAVFANMYLHHSPDPAAAVREMVRVLRPGGRLVITDLNQHDHAWMREEMADTWPGFERGQVRQWLREAGLVNVIVDCTSESCCATSEISAGGTGSEQAAIGVFVATGSRRVVGAKEAVEANYGAVARGDSCGCGGEVASSSCCTTSLCCTSSSAPITLDDGTEGSVRYDTTYSPHQLAAVPPESVQLSLGCGNPTALASLKQGETILDIGSGGGIDVFYAARRVGPTGRAIGLDMTSAMIERAQRSAQAAGLHNVEFRLGDAQAMPVDDATVDVILSNCVINLTEDKGKVFEEAYRVLRPDGRLSISDMVTDRPLPASFRGDASRWAGCVHGALPEQEYLDLVRQAGFVDIQSARTMSGGDVDDVQVYSLSVAARKAA